MNAILNIVSKVLKIILKIIMVILKILIVVIGALSFLWLFLALANYYIGGLSYVHYTAAVVLRVCLFIGISLLVLAALIIAMKLIFKGKQPLQAICMILIPVFAGFALYVGSTTVLLASFLGPYGCSYTQNIADYGTYDDPFDLPHFPKQITEDMTVVEFAYYHKYLDRDQTDIYLEVKFDDKETMGKYLSEAKKAFSGIGLVEYKNPYNELYTDVIGRHRHSYVAFDYPCVNIYYSSITYSYEELTIIYNETDIGDDIILGSNPEKGEYYPKLLERFDVLWDRKNNFSSYNLFDQTQE